jgi:hypothetical protein
MTIYVARGYSHREVEVRCGSTAIDGGVNQCDKCAAATPVVPVREDESDADWYVRQADAEELRLSRMQGW